MPPPSSSQFSQNTVTDWLFSFEAGQNSGVSPLLLPKNQLAYSSNATNRGTLIHPRPPRRNYTLDFGGDTALQNAVTKGLFQGRCFYKPDAGNEYLLASISGRLFKFVPNPATLIATVTEVTGGNPQSATALQCWLWQAENFVIWNDGVNVPVFFDGTTTKRTGVSPPSYLVASDTTLAPNGLSGGVSTLVLTQTFIGTNGDKVTLSPGTITPQIGTVISGAGTNTIGVNFPGVNIPTYFVAAGTVLFDNSASQGGFVTSGDVIIPAGYVVGTSTSTVNLTSNYPGSINDNVVFANSSTFATPGIITAIAGPILTVKLFPPAVNGVTSVQFKILSGTSMSLASVLNSKPQFPVGRMGAYGRGRIWMCMADGKQFIAGDIVGGPSGTPSLNYRDSILNITENSYLAGGGTFTVPGSFGDIRSMIFTAELDASLGQGPLQIFTPTHVFSCNAPIDRTTWQSLTNPIQTVSAIGNGGLGQDNTFLVNSDTIYRAVDGIRSLILSRQDFNTWVRTPISREVERTLNLDNQSLLPFGSGVFFDNRILMTVSPISTTQGVYHQALVALNNDLISTVREKSPPAYDGIWPGMNILNMVSETFSSVERCYQFVYNTVLQNLELWELMPSAASEVENNPNVPIVGDLISGTPTAIEWWFESSSLFRDRNPGERTYKQLNNGELMVDKLVGRVDFEVWYKPDQYPCWTLWHSWGECATVNSSSKPPQFRPRMGLGTPSVTPCDPSTNRPLREGFTFQIKVVITGQCEIVGMRFESVVKPQPTFAPLACDNIC